MDVNKQPGIRFDNVILKELVFSREQELPQIPSLNINFSYGISFSNDKKQCSSELTCIIKDETSNINIKCSMLGIFSVDSKNENMDITNFAENNAPAHLLPFVREVIMSTTLRAGIPSIILPPLNIFALLNKNEEAKQP